MQKLIIMYDLMRKHEYMYLIAWARIYKKETTYEIELKSILCLIVYISVHFSVLRFFAQFKSATRAEGHLHKNVHKLPCNDTSVGVW